MRSQSGARSVLVALALLLVALLAGARARAEDASSELPPLPITLELSGCTALDRVELFKLLAVEFQTLNVLAETPRERVHVACAAERARVTLDSGSSSNEVDLAATAPAVWPRLLALSVSEIVIESRARATAPSTPAAAPKPVPPAPQKIARIGRENGRVRAFAGIALRRAVRPATWLSGPQLGLALAVGRHFSVGADLRVELGRASTPLATVDWLSASASLVALARGTLGRVGLGVGPGWSVGYSRLSPTVRVANANGHVVSGAWAAPELVARASYELSARWFALGGLDAGIVTAQVTGLVNGEQRLLDTGGPFVSALLGAGVAF